MTQKVAKKEAMALSKRCRLSGINVEYTKKKSANLQKKKEIFICDVKSIETDKKDEWNVLSIWYGIVERLTDAGYWHHSLWIILFFAIQMSIFV